MTDDSLGEHAGQWAREPQRSQQMMQQGPQIMGQACYQPPQILRQWGMCGDEPADPGDSPEP